MIRTLAIMNLLFIQSNAFSPVIHQSNKAKHDVKLFGTSGSNTNAFSDSYYGSKNTKSRNDESKLYFQSPTDVDIWIEGAKEVTTDFPLISTELIPSLADITDYQLDNNVVKMMSLAYEGRLLVEKIRNTASLINDEELFCYMNGIHDKKECKESYNREVIKQNYEIALRNAKDADLKYGLCSEESSSAWNIVDEIYIKYESYDKENAKNESKHQLEDILKACEMLETTFLDLQKKMN